MLDDDFPQGSPNAVTCRHCSAVKVKIRGGLLCGKCDAPDSAIATWAATP